VAVFAAWMVYTRVDLLSVDVAGHLSSAQAFARGYYHRFYDGHFLGSIHGLFYPPLEDALLSAWISLAGVLHVDVLTAYRAYLATVAAGYVAAVATLGGAIPAGWARLAFGAFVLTTFFLRDDDLFLQGMKLVDLAKYGLTAQLLGGIFLCLLVRELLARQRISIVALSLAGAVLAHLVVGLVAALVVAWSIVGKRDRRLAVASALAAGLAAFFWVPLLVHSSFMVKNTVLSGHRPFAFLAAAIAVAVTSQRAGVRLLAVPASLLLVPSSIARWIHDLPVRLTDFHWYRLDFPALLLLSTAACLAMSPPAAAEPSWRMWTVRASAVVCAGATLLLLASRGLYVPSGGPVRIEGGFPVREAPDAPYGRHWILQDGRPFEFSAESLATALDDSQRTPKGLFWESDKSNHLVGSYMASFNHPPVVLDYFYFHSFDCRFQACLVDHFLADFNVTRWSADDRMLSPPGPDSDHRACDGSLWNAHLTPSFELEEQDGFTLSGHHFRTAVVSPRGPLTNGAVELVDPASVQPLALTGKRYFHRYFHDIGPQCTHGAEAQSILLVRDDWPRFLDLTQGLAPGDRSLVAPSMQRVGMGRFSVEVPSPTDVLIRIKLNYLPGVRLLHDDGSEIPVMRAYPGMLAIGRGRLTLVYEQTTAMRIGSALSIATAVGWALFGLLRAWRSRRNAANG
jgi:hypothetical protein